MLKDTECLNHRPYSSWIFMWKRSRTRCMTLLADIASLTHLVDKENDSIDVGHNVLWLSILILYQLIQNPAFQLLPWNSKVHYYSTTLMIQTAIRPSNYHRKQSTSPSLPTLHLVHKTMSSGTLATLNHWQCCQVFILPSKLAYPILGHECLNTIVPTLTPTYTNNFHLIKAKTTHYDKWIVKESSF